MTIQYDVILLLQQVNCE